MVQNFKSVRLASLCLVNFNPLLGASRVMEDLIRKMTDLKTLSPKPCKIEEEISLNATRSKDSTSTKKGSKAS